MSQADSATRQQRYSRSDGLVTMTNDPHVTTIGKAMRKRNLDELPQLFNVIGRSMSFIRPRPPLPSEVGQYADHVHHRFLMKPDIAGAWQVGERSTPSWGESARLDLAYVENRSLIGDLLILLKIVRTANTALGEAH